MPLKRLLRLEEKRTDAATSKVRFGHCVRWRSETNRPQASRAGVPERLSQRGTCIDLEPWQRVSRNHIEKLDTPDDNPHHTINRMAQFIRINSNFEIETDFSEEKRENKEKMKNRQNVEQTPKKILTK